MRFLSAIAVVFALLLAASPAFAGKGVCRTPDGFVFGMQNTGNGLTGNGMGGTGIDRNGMGGTGLHNGNGMGGTGAKFTERKGMGGTGIDGDIGVYGRITAFGSICVNGMEIEYTKMTPVNNEGGKASAQSLKIGQMVAVRAYKDNKGDFRARRIAIDKIVSGRVTRIDQKHGEFHVMKDLVLLGAKSRGQMKDLRDGDYVAVSGLRRADGAIVASHIEKTTKGRAAQEQSPRSLFGSGVKYFSLQGYVKSAGSNGRIRMADGTVIQMAKDTKLPSANERVIIFGIVSPSGLFTAETIIPEVKAFIPAVELGLLTGPDGLPLLAQHQGGPQVSLPSIAGLPAANVEVPTVDVPPIDIPGAPTIDLPPVEVPNIPTPPVVPDLPLLGR
jgi:hypothetical protein